MPQFLRIALAVIVVSLACASSAQAEVRTGSGTDPSETEPSLSREPSHEDDFQQLRVAYDRSAGTLFVAVRFYFPITTTTAFETFVEVATDGLLDNDLSLGCDTFEAVTFRAATAPDTSVGSFSASGFSGTSPATVTWSADRHEMFITATHAALVGRDLRCAEANQRRYDEFGHCSGQYCDRISHWYDGDSLPAFWLTGFGPIQTPVQTPQAKPETIKCSGTVGHGFFHKITATKVTCAQAKRLARDWIKRSGFAYRTPRKSLKIGVWRCKLVLFRGTGNPYGRVACATKSGKGVKFYGTSYGAGRDARPSAASVVVALANPRPIARGPENA